MFLYKFNPLTKKEMKKNPFYNNNEIIGYKFIQRDKIFVHQKKKK